MTTLQSPLVAVIGGSGFYQLSALTNSSLHIIETPYGDAHVEQGLVSGSPVIFMMRHGGGHKLPPHKVNYRANIWALNKLGVQSIIAINAVGGIGELCGPGIIAIPDQLIDYSYGRDHTFADELTDELNHIEFAEPYSPALRQRLITAAQILSLEIQTSGCYACTQGPRLETAAEIERLKRDGNTLVGMTAMPEAALARELAIDYASVCIVANWGAGLSDEPITLEDIHRVLNNAVDKVQGLVESVLS